MLNSYNSIVLFKVYLIIANSLMIFISIIVTSEVWKVLKITLLILIFDYVDKDSQIYILNQALQSQRMWLLSLSLLESFLILENNNRILYNIALCYQELDFFYIAEYYYNKIGPNSSYYIYALKKLNIIYQKIDR